MTFELFITWVRDIFLPATVVKRRCNKVVVLMDNFSGHVSLEAQRLLVEMMWCPCTSRLMPLIGYSPWTLE